MAAHLPPEIGKVLEGLFKKRSLNFLDVFL